MPYANLDGTTPDKNLIDLLKWRLGGPKRRPDTAFVPPWRENDGTALQATAPHLTWIGHATFAQRLAGKLVVTDPIWATRMATVKRSCPPGVPLSRMPRPDIVTISHSHYDHLDLPTLRRIGPDVTYVVPTDVGDLLRDAGLPRVVELGWWETHREGDLEITLVPAQHWSMRVPWDRNRRLWGGFVYRSPEVTTYHAGDTAFKEEVFASIAERFPAIDFAMLPIGAYDPPWFMQPQHMGPEEAGRAWEILRARVLVAMHWATFKLTDEPLAEPAERLRAWWGERDPERLWIVDAGDTRPLTPPGTP
jgi:N-acyl-phosphatidylethanolamine-hydrolysing phospholipase D